MKNRESPILSQLMAVIEDRQAERPANSYTVKLLDGGVAAIGAKIREEADELVQAAYTQDVARAHLVHESADLLYHLLVMLAHQGVGLDEVEAELARRFGASGLEEKASRDRGGPSA